MGEDMEVWKQVFQELMQEVKPWHKWTLMVDKGLLPNVLKPNWLQYQQKTFARFQCSLCSRSWASGHVLVVFHMHWCGKKCMGQVKMRVFAQKCKKCPQPPFEIPEFTQDNITRILNNLVFKILKKCYGEAFKQMEEIPLVGDASLEGPHDSNNCEACLQGFCAQSGLGLASKSPVPPLSPTPSKSTREPTVPATCINIPCSQTPLKVEKPRASTVNPKVSNPTKADPKVNHTPKSSTVPLATEVISHTPKYVHQMRSPIQSSRAADVATKNIRPKTQNTVPSSSSLITPTSSFVPPTSSLVAPTSSSLAMPSSSSLVTHTSWNPPANTTCRVETYVGTYPSSGCILQSFCSCRRF
uniref:3CxxC-type domain-containing protein n=1 Tax=Nannospalax galili TaxID=1026970 RepID=A0A8C6QQM0_NANGA